MVMCGLTLSETSPVFYVSAAQVFWKHCGKRGNCSKRAISPFPIMFSTHLDGFSAIFIKFEIVLCKLFQFGKKHHTMNHSISSFTLKLHCPLLCYFLWPKQWNNDILLFSIILKFYFVNLALYGQKSVIFTEENMVSNEVLELLISACFPELTEWWKDDDWIIISVFSTSWIRN